MNMNYENLHNMHSEQIRILKIAFFDTIVEDEGLYTKDSKLEYAANMYKILDMSDDERVNYLINNDLTKTEKGFIARLLQFNEIDPGNQFHKLAIDVFYHYTMESK